MLDAEFVVLRTPQRKSDHALPPERLIEYDVDGGEQLLIPILYLGFSSGLCVTKAKPPSGRLRFRMENAGLAFCVSCVIALQHLANHFQSEFTDHRVSNRVDGARSPVLDMLSSPRRDPRQWLPA
ncbi:MAG: hypothetical protein U1D30_26800 [Planctomycetota bacterium]